MRLDIIGRAFDHRSALAALSAAQAEEHIRGTQRNVEAALRAAGVEGGLASGAPYLAVARFVSSLRISSSLAFRRRSFTGPTRSRIFWPADSDSRAASAYW